MPVWKRLLDFLSGAATIATDMGVEPLTEEEYSAAPFTAIAATAASSSVTTAQSLTISGRAFRGLLKVRIYFAHEI
jgi:hypothetical protein